MPFSLSGDPSQTEISDAINYLLNNFGSNVSIDVNTGIVAGPVGGIGYLYKYLDIKYATSFDGSVGFSNSPTNATYYGARNNNSSVESSNPTDYIWTQVTGGFGTTKFIFYQTTGGRQINIVVATTAPTSNYVQDTGPAIDLDIVTGASGVSGASGASGASGVSGYSGLSGFSGTSGYSGLSGFSGTIGANGLAAITAYLVQSQTSSAPATPSNTTGPTAPSGWYLTAPSVSVGQVLWYSFGQYNSSTNTVNGIPAGQTQWGTPTAASIFQDIRSDNWNGSNPPTPGTVSTYGTSGYYIQRSSGDVWFNSVYGRGIAQFDGSNNATGGYSAAILANASYGQSVGVEGYTNNTFLTSGALRGYNTSSGNGNAIYGYQNSTGNGVLGQSASGIGVYGTGATGVQGNGNTGVIGNGTNGVFGNGTSAGVYGSGGTYGVYGSGTYGVYANGPFGTSSNSYVNNLYSQFTVNLVGQGSGTLLYFQTGPTTGASTATFNPTNKPGATSGSNTWIEIVINGSSYQIPVWAS